MIKCCIMCRVPDLEGVACYDRACKCHWYLDHIYTGKTIQEIINDESGEAQK